MNANNRVQRMRTQGAINANTGTATDADNSRNRDGRWARTAQTATFIHHTVATEKQRAVQYMINKNNFNTGKLARTASLSPLHRRYARRRAGGGRGRSGSMSRGATGVRRVVE